MEWLPIVMLTPAETALRVEAKHSADGQQTMLLAYHGEALVHAARWTTEEWAGQSNGAMLIPGFVTEAESRVRKQQNVDAGSNRESEVSLQTAAGEFKANIDRYLIEYMVKHGRAPERYPLRLEANNSGLWIEFMMDFHVNGIV